MSNLFPHTFVNDALKSDDGKQSARDGGGGNGAQDDQSKEAPGVSSALALEEESDARPFEGLGGCHDGKQEEEKDKERSEVEQGQWEEARLLSIAMGCAWQKFKEYTFEAL